jgi:hypothetical protein
MYGHLDFGSQRASALASQYNLHASPVPDLATHVLEDIAQLEDDEQRLRRTRSELEADRQNLAFVVDTGSTHLLAIAQKRALFLGKSTDLGWLSARVSRLDAQILRISAVRSSMMAEFLKEQRAAGGSVPPMELLIALEQSIPRLRAGKAEAIPWEEFFDATGSMLNPGAATQLWNAYLNLQPHAPASYRANACETLEILRSELVAIAFAKFQGSYVAPLRPQRLTVRFSSSLIPDDTTHPELVSRQHEDRGTGAVTTKEWSYAGHAPFTCVLEFEEADGRRFYYSHDFIVLND